jgi:PAS domain-containing protein
MQFVFRAQSSGGSESPFANKPPIVPELISKILDAPNVGFAICDEQLRYLYINDALAKLNGVPPAAHYGRTVREILGDIAARTRRLP